jgi:hypothetical protein
MSLNVFNTLADRQMPNEESSFEKFLSSLTCIITDDSFVDEVDIG